MSPLERCIANLLVAYEAACRRAEERQRWREERFFFHLARITPPLTSVRGHDE